jgi:undecaprenyl-diphosphatase
LNDYALAVLLGIVEGVTEFLPVSSTAHLRIAEEWLGLPLSDGYWKMFTVVIQLGAILVLPIYFRAKLWHFAKTFPGGESGEGSPWVHPLTLTTIAWIVTAVPSFLLSKLIGKNLESMLVIGVSLALGGVVMWIIDARFGSAAAAMRQRTGRVEDMSLGQAIWIGACQVLSAVFPGTSRSMSTIAGGQVAGMSRPSALEFSFLLSIPTMVSATGYTILKSMRHGAEGTIFTAPANTHEWTLLAIGFVMSFIVAYGVVAWFMRWVRNRGFAPFAIYRILLGLLILSRAF